MFLLDGNVVSELRRPRPHEGVLAWRQSVDEVQLHLSAVTVGDIQAGVEPTREQDPDKARDMEAWLEQGSAASSVLPMDGATFRLGARLMHRRSAAVVLLRACRQHRRDA